MTLETTSLTLSEIQLYIQNPVSPDCSSYRQLAHFFDPSPKYGVVEINKK